MYEAFLNLADKKKEVYDEDLESLVNERERNESALYTLEGVQISCGFPLTPTATVTLRNQADQVVTACEYGAGPIDAMCKAVNKIVQVDNDLTEFSVQSVTRGIDALGEVTIRVTDPSGDAYTGRGADGDIVVSSQSLPQRAQPPAQRQAGAAPLGRPAARRRADLRPRRCGTQSTAHVSRARGDHAPRALFSAASRRRRGRRR